MLIRRFDTTFEPATLTSQTGDVALQINSHAGPANAGSLYRALRETDLAKDFVCGVAALVDIFRTLHAGKQPHVTGVFLDALENRFALVVSPGALRDSRLAFGRASAALKDVQGLPTTKGIVVADRGGSQLIAWRVDTNSAECASIEMNALSSYLTRGVLPAMRYEVGGRRGLVSGAGFRDLAGFAHNLRSRESRLRPLAVDDFGGTAREWTTKQLRRIGHKEAHRVREHLRLAPTAGKRTVVSEHARYGVSGWSAAEIRVRLL